MSMRDHISSYWMNSEDHVRAYDKHRKQGGDAESYVDSLPLDDYAKGNIYELVSDTALVEKWLAEDAEEEQEGEAK